MTKYEATLGDGKYSCPLTIYLLHAYLEIEYLHISVFNTHPLQ